MISTRKKDLPAFPSVVEALAYWSERNCDDLFHAVVPPCGVTGDQVADAMLAHLFALTAQLPSIASRLTFLAFASDLHRKNAGPVADVVDAWRESIKDAAERDAVEGRAA